MNAVHVVISVIVAIFAFAIIAYVSRSFGFIYWRKFKLNLYEARYLNAYSKKIKRDLISGFCKDIFIGFYLDIVREMSKKQLKDRMLILRLMDFCLAIIKKKYYLSSVIDNDSFFKETLPGEIYENVKDKERLLRILSEEEERELFNRDLRRIKRIINYLTATFDKNHPEQLYGQICSLASSYENISVVPVRSLYYNTHCFMADYDRVLSLKLYLRYLNVKSSSATYKYKAIMRDNADKLFDDKAQKRKFAAILEQFRQDNDLEKALEQVDSLFIHVRRKINLHIESIKEAKANHNEVALILGQYLDSEEPEKEEPPAVFEQDDRLNHQKDLFDLFISKSFRLNRQEINIFADSRGLFRDTFIERINDSYFDMFDDLLIEEDGDYYVLNEDYYQQIND